MCIRDSPSVLPCVQWDPKLGDADIADPFVGEIMSYRDIEPTEIKCSQNTPQNARTHTHTHTHTRTHAHTHTHTHTHTQTHTHTHTDTHTHTHTRTRDRGRVEEPLYIKKNLKPSRLPAV